MNAANEVLVHSFIAGSLPWHAIAIKLEELMLQHSVQKVDSLEAILAADAQARSDASGLH
jgi:1-deoxy-D-xylulose-5-phosphate reductoisomerase